MWRWRRHFWCTRKKRGMLLIASLAAAAVLQAGRLVEAPALLGGSRGAAGAGKHSGGCDLDARCVRADAAGADGSECSAREECGGSSASSSATSSLPSALSSSSSSTRHPPGRFRRAEVGVDRVAGVACAFFRERSAVPRSGERDGAGKRIAWVVTGAIGSTPATQRRDVDRYVCGSATGVQLGRAGESRGGVDGALRQSASGAVRRIPAISAVVCICRRIDQGGGRVSRRERRARRWMREAPGWESSSATSRYFRTRCGSSRIRARRCL
jgi:hypothetical protein